MTPRSWLQSLSQPQVALLTLRLAAGFQLLLMAATWKLWLIPGSFPLVPLLSLHLPDISVWSHTLAHLTLPLLNFVTGSTASGVPHCPSLSATGRNGVHGGGDGASGSEGS